MQWAFSYARFLPSLELNDTCIILESHQIYQYCVGILYWHRLVLEFLLAKKRTERVKRVIL